MDLKLYHFEFEANEKVEGRTSYAGPFNWVIFASDERHAERLFDERLKKKGLFLENEEGEEPHGYNFTVIPRRPGVTEISG